MSETAYGSPEDVVRGPDWFSANTSPDLYTSRFVNVQGCNIHYLHWPGRSHRTAGGKRAGIVFVHGNGAHAHWWTHMAPFFTKDYDCIAISNSGNGLSGWRDAYSFNVWADEAIACAKDCGMLSADCRSTPIIVAHSMGVLVAMALAQGYSDLLGGLVLVDELPRPPNYFEGFPGIPTEPMVTRVRSYSDSPRDNFKLLPPQRVQNKFIADYIADHSTSKAPDGTDGWIWAFDPAKMLKMQGSKHAFPDALLQFLSVDAVRALTLKTTFIVGEFSAIMDPALLEWNRAVLGDEISIIEIQQAAHHIMMDQPLALVAAIASTLAEWRRSELRTPSGAVVGRLDGRCMQSDFDLENDAAMLMWNPDKYMRSKRKGMGNGDVPVNPDVRTRSKL